MVNHTTDNLVPPLLVHFTQTGTNAVGTMTDTAGTHGDFLTPVLPPSRTPEEDKPQHHHDSPEWMAGPLPHNA